jgi:hypothetical protein
MSRHTKQVRRLHQRVEITEEDEKNPTEEQSMYSTAVKKREFREQTDKCRKS